ncbi:uncharacterized protein LOC100250039 isoform X3 [Vitis vinifera]|uniref:uncharacterized protein LOC100250039 isoform X3 n=1 Tax=Vitis vinifera TaxID=29760 RepID=UPI00053F31A5|nr:uncharacterized protein LOC100250039 isoform X3 [Vitis vinifera]|eukprot:XP_010653153.1 PREDICTED: uncharacterized protein LOC100250039 isoform X3 [Vitis vinifera]
MTSKTLRRRLHHGDVDGKRHEHLETSGLDGLNEPLLGNYEYDDKDSEGPVLKDLWDDERRKEHQHWTILFSHLIAEWAQWLANIVIGSGTLLKRLLPFDSTTQNGQSKKILPPSLSPLQGERLRNMQQRLEVPFDGSCVEHQDTFQRLLHKLDGNRADWEYPFAVAGINISFMLIQMLDLQSGKPTSQAAVRFLQLLGEDEMAFDNLFCVAFQMMDAQWLAKRASYMEFNDVLKSTRTQLERELELEDVFSVRDLPAYNMLRR